MKIYSPWELNAMTLDERKAALDGEFGDSFHASAREHITWIAWARDTDGVLGLRRDGCAHGGHDGCDRQKMVSHALLLRVVSFVRLHAGLPACKAIQFIARGIVPAKKHDLLLHISVIF